MPSPKTVVQPAPQCRLREAGGALFDRGTARMGPPSQPNLPTGRPDSKVTETAGGDADSIDDCPRTTDH